MSNEKALKRSAEAKAIDAIWLGDLSGWELATDLCGEETIEIFHRCGFHEYTNGDYLGNILTNTVIPHMERGCINEESNNLRRS